jgi:hypothetical protein
MRGHDVGASRCHCQELAGREESASFAGDQRHALAAHVTLSRTRSGVHGAGARLAIRVCSWGEKAGAHVDDP